MRIFHILPLATLAIAAIATAAAPAAEPGGWAALPAGFAPGRARIRILANGAPVEIRIRPGPEGSADGDREERAADGIRLFFRRMPAAAASLPAGGALAVELDRDGSDHRVEVEAFFPEWGRAHPARPSAPAERDVFFLTLHGGGLDVARVLHDPARGRTLDMAGVHPALQLDVPRAPLHARTPGAAAARDLLVRIQGPVVRARRAVVLAWEERPDGLPRPEGPRGRPPWEDEALADAGWLAGWSIPGGDDLVRRSERAAAEGWLRPGGAIEIGDGWQGKTRGAREPVRSWTEALDAGKAASSLAEARARLESLGARPALWIVPHGEGTSALFEREPAAFTRDEKEHAISAGFLGPYVVDGTAGPGAAHLTRLFEKLGAMGFRAYRLAGLGEALAFHEREWGRLTEKSIAPPAAMAATLRAIRAGAGDGAVLAGDLGTPLDLARFLDAGRPAGEAADGHDPLRLEGLAAARAYHLHGRVWRTECLPIQPPPRGEADPGAEGIEETSAAARALFAALTGRGMVISGSAGMRPAPARAMEILRLGWPPLPVRPLDLTPARGTPRIWVLKTGAADIVAAVNWSALASRAVRIDPRDLGFAVGSGEGLMAFDVLRETFLPLAPGGWELLLLPGEARLLVVRERAARPAALTATGHALGAALIEEAWDPERGVLAGRVAYPPGSAGWAEPSRLVAACPREWRVTGARSTAGAEVFADSGAHVTVPLGPAGEGGGAAFSIQFARAEPPGSAPFRPFSRPSRLDVSVTWSAAERKALLEVSGAVAPWSGLEALRDGKPLPRMGDSRLLDGEVVPGARHLYEVRLAAGAEGGPMAGRAVFSAPAPAGAWLDEWSMALFREDASPPERRRSAAGVPLFAGGRRFERGIGVRGPARIEYDLGGAYERLEAVPAVDDAARFEGSVVFAVAVDGVEKWRSGVVRGGAEDPKPVAVDLGGGRRLALIVEDAGDGPMGDLAVWGDARVVAAR